MCAVPEAEEEDCRTASFLAAEAGVILLCCCVRGITRLLIRRRIFLFRFWLLLHARPRFADFAFSSGDLAWLGD